MPDDLGDTGLDPGPAPLGLLLQERLLLGKAERDDGAVDRDRPAFEDQGLGGRVLAEPLDDGRPGSGDRQGRRRQRPAAGGRGAVDDGAGDASAGAPDPSAAPWVAD